MKIPRKSLPPELRKQVAKPKPRKRTRSGPPADLTLLREACREAGFMGFCEYRFTDKRMWRFDLAFPAQKVAFEKEGGVWVGGAHTRGKHFESDCEKYNTAAAVLGWLVLRGTPEMIQRGEILPLLLQALEARS